MSTDLSGVTHRACRAMLRLAWARWLIAELIPFGFLAAGLAVARAGAPLHLAGSVLATFANWAVCIVYFYRVLGSAAGWVTALFPLIVANAWAGAVTFARDGTGAASPRLALASVLALALAVAAGAAVRNGERWARRSRGRCHPGRTFEAYSWSRGALTGLWLALAAIAAGAGPDREPSRCDFAPFWFCFPKGGLGTGPGHWPEWSRSRSGHLRRPGFRSLPCGLRPGSRPGRRKEGTSVPRRTLRHAAAAAARRGGNSFHGFRHSGI